MKKIGIIGGAGPLASALFYQTLIEACLGFDEQPEIVLINYPFTRGLSKEESTAHFAILVQELQYCVDVLHLQGVEVFSIVCNTLHSFLGCLNLYGMENLSLPDSVMKKVEGKGVKTLLVLATETTMEQHVYQSQKVNVIYPHPEEQKIVSRVIDHVLSGEISKEDTLALQRCIEKVSLRHSIDGVVLGCTDLPVLHARFPLEWGTIPLFDSVKIAAKELYKLSLS